MIAARPLIDGVSAIGWLRSQLVLNTGTLTCGNWVGTAGRDGNVVAVGAGRALAAGRAAMCAVAVLVVAATGWRSRWACSSPNARMPSKRTTATIASRMTGVRRRGGTTRRRDVRRPRVPRL